MKYKWIVILGVIITFGLIAEVAYAQEPTPSSGFNPDSIAPGFASLAFWVALLATLVAGAVGGVVYELLILQGNIEIPHRADIEETPEGFPYARAKNLFDLGIWARVIIGALAAVAALFILSPSTPFALLSTAIIAGSAGSAIFSSMQDRLTAALAQSNEARTLVTADKQDAKVGEAMEAFANCKKTLVEASTSPSGTMSLTFDTGAKGAIDLEDLDRVEQLLSEARGIHERI